MNTPLSRLQHDLSLAPGIPDSYRLFGEGPTVSTYGDLREVVGAVTTLVTALTKCRQQLRFGPYSFTAAEAMEAADAALAAFQSQKAAPP